MCLACEEQEYFFRLWCADFLARGDMPPGVSAEDLQALGLPQPKGAAKPVASPTPVPNAFACDSPDE